MKTKELLNKIEELFTAKLSAKTGWGRNEILTAYKDSVSEALLEAMAELESKENPANKRSNENPKG